MIVNKLYWQKYRPKKLDAMILLPRIKSEIMNAEGEVTINNNLLFYGGPGNGKSSLAELLIPKGSLVINASYSSSVDDLREEVTEYCKQVGSSIFDDDYDPNKTLFKFVYLNEFDGVSQKYQEALKAFIEEHAGRVRFIATVNNMSKLSAEILSRFTQINFDPANGAERDWLMEQYIERAQLVCDKNSLTIEPAELESLVRLSFPDMRTIMNQLQRVSHTDNLKESIKGLNIDFYNLVFDKQAPEVTYAWVISNYGDKVEPLLKLCGRYLAEYIMQYKPDRIGSIPLIMPVVTKYSNMLPTAIDPVVLALACIYEIQNLLKAK